MSLTLISHRLAKDERGTILAFWAVSLGVLLGIVALSFDLGRASITRSELQSFADSVALAAAGELDGNDDAINRATAAATLIADTHSFGNTDRDLAGATDYQLTFFTTLPAADAMAMTDVTTDPAEAAYVRVAVTPTVVESTFGAAFAGLTGQENRDFDLGATAVAGLAIYACDVTPMMFCLPGPDFKAKDHIGEMIRLRSGGTGAAWGPGDFGFLDPDSLMIDEGGPCANMNGAQQKRCLLAAVDGITQCFNQRGVDMEPGQRVGIEDSAFNVRFDMYGSQVAWMQNDPDFAPAPNVIKGILPKGNCRWNNPTVSPNTVRIPRDDCFGSGGCSRFGTGVWAAGRANYVAVNYGGNDPHPTALTRYQYYLAEIAAAAGGNILSGLAETGRPMCSSSAPAGPDRRVIIVAGIDCAANAIGGAAQDVPVKEFFKIFLTEPVGQDGSNPRRLDIWGEVIGSASEVGTGATGVGGIVRDVVQLYR